MGLAAANPKEHNDYAEPFMNTDGANTSLRCSGTIDGVARESISHEVDHIARFAAGLLALEIEWNNKDPFFDRDLENYKGLHADGAISLGILVTRGVSLQDEMRSMVLRFATEKNINEIADLERMA